ncbi:hypothetical protein ASF91_15185 [Rhizobium sp. Leaf155]|nr:hypothetical protein ASF91_15185 [Rhizobium sp. Leaf155]
MNEAIRHTGMAVEDALTSVNTVTACLARIASSSMAIELHNLVNAELNRGTDVSTLLTAFAIFQVQTHSSVAAQLTGPKSCIAFQRLYEQMIGDDYMDHAIRTREAMDREADEIDEAAL